MNWDLPEKPAELAEKRIIKAILDGVFPINSSLPSERELANRIGVTRPTLREALQRLSRDGWIEIHQGKTTRIKDYWSEGNLNVLSSISKYPEYLSPNFVENLLQIRSLLCPTYSRMAVAHNPKAVINYLDDAPKVDESPETFSDFDFNLHLKLTQASGNPMFTLILNGFMHLFTEKAILYFQIEAARIHSRNYYQNLRDSFVDNDPLRVFELSEKVMNESLEIWKNASSRIRSEK